MKTDKHTTAEKKLHEWKGKFKGDTHVSGSTASDPLFVASAWMSLPWKQDAVPKSSRFLDALSCFCCLMQLDCDVPEKQAGFPSGAVFSGFCVPAALLAQLEFFYTTLLKQLRKHVISAVLQFSGCRYNWSILKPKVCVFRGS